MSEDTLFTFSRTWSMLAILVCMVYLFIESLLCLNYSNIIMYLISKILTPCIGSCAVFVDVNLIFRFIKQYGVDMVIRFITLHKDK